MYDEEATSFEDLPEDARRPLKMAVDECSEVAAQLAKLVMVAERRVAPLRLSVPKPEISNDSALKPARDLHSPIVDRIYSLRDEMRTVSQRLSTLLDELEV